jgi:hypothetical protein
VRAAEDPEECAELEVRYQSAQTEAANRSASANLKDFEAAITHTVVVIARSVNEVQRLATSDKEVYATFHQLVGAGIKIPEDNKWDTVRVLTDHALFPGYKEQIRFAALSLDGIGLSNYGACSIVFRTDMIEHRTSVFEENSTLFMKHHNIEIWNADKLPRGYRATWKDRGKLCIAKLSKKIHAGTQSSDYPKLLLRQGTTPGEDEFVEAHICGPMTARTMQLVTFSPHRNPPERVIIEALKEMLDKIGVLVKES